MKKTEWFPASENPVHVGFYETKRFAVGPEARGIHKLYWDGFSWRYAYRLGMCEKGDLACMDWQDGDEWRGLTEKAS